MGRNFPSASQVAFQLLADLQQIAAALPPQDRLLLKHFGEMALNKRGAIANAASEQPFEVMLLVLLMEEHKTGERRYQELRAQLEGLLQTPPP